MEFMYRAITSVYGTAVQRAFWPAREEALAHADAVRAQVVRLHFGNGRGCRHAVCLPLHLEKQE